MTALLDGLGQWVLNHYAFRHLIIAVGVIIQGEITILIGVYLVLKHYLGWGGFLLAVSGGLFVYEIFFYSLGKFLQKKKLGVMVKEKILSRPKMRLFLHNHTDRFLVLSKFIVYINVGVIILSGLMDIKVKRFFKARLAANVLWAGSMIIGSFLIISGFTLLRIHQIEFAVLVFLVLVFGGEYVFSKLVGKEVEIEEKAEEIGEKIERL